jgi:Lar family restriction alleviation protein
MPDKRKNCPFCGSNNVGLKTLQEPYSYNTTYAITCQKCGARGPETGTKNYAIKEWNNACKRQK